MNSVYKAIIIVTAAAAFTVDVGAFTTNSRRITAQSPLTRSSSLIKKAVRAPHETIVTQLYSSDDDDRQDNEIERLKQMAAKLRAEAASLEAEKATQLAEAAEKAFRKFDVNSGKADARSPSLCYKLRDFSLTFFAFRASSQMVKCRSPSSVKALRRN